MKFLCVCEGGVVRSGAMAFQLKSNGQDAIAISWKWNSDETFDYMCLWADYIILMQEIFLDKKEVFNTYKNKVRVVDVGLDIYGNPLHMGLNESLQHIVLDWASRNYNI